MGHFTCDEWCCLWGSQRQKYKDLYVIETRVLEICS